MTAVLGAILAVVLYYSCMPREDTLVSGVGFYSDLMSQLMNVKQSWAHCGKGSKSDRNFDVPKDWMSPLPHVYEAGDDTWREKVGANFDQPIVIRKLIQAEPSRFNDLLKLNRTLARDLWKDETLDVFTHMSQDKSAIRMTMSDYYDQMLNKTKKLYARAIPDSSGFIAKQLDMGWLASLLNVPMWTLSSYLESDLPSFEFYGQMKKLSTSNYIGSLNKGMPLMFMGSNHVWSQVHCDISTSAFLMVEGRKRWVFYSPEQTPYLYPYGQHYNLAFNAGLDAFAPDIKERPLFAKARGYEVVIGPGDVLLFPSLWWHGVQNVDEVTIGIDIPFIDMVGSWRRNSFLTMATLWNPKLTFKTLLAKWNSQSVRDVFFGGYSVLTKQEVC